MKQLAQQYGLYDYYNGYGDNIIIPFNEFTSVQNLAIDLILNNPGTFLGVEDDGNGDGDDSLCVFITDWVE